MKTAQYRLGLFADNSRQSFKANNYITDYDVSTKVESTGAVICERVM